MATDWRLAVFKLQHSDWSVCQVFLFFITLSSLKLVVAVTYWEYITWPGQNVGSCFFLIHTFCFVIAKVLQNLSEPKEHAQTREITLNSFLQELCPCLDLEILVNLFFFFNPLLHRYSF